MLVPDGTRWVHDALAPRAHHRGQMARTGMNLRLTHEARRGWEKACREQGVTLTAFVEAIGLELDEHGVVACTGEQVVERARQIDLERRNRR